MEKKIKGIKIKHALLHQTIVDIVVYLQPKQQARAHIYVLFFKVFKAVCNTYMCALVNQ